MADAKHWQLFKVGDRFLKLCPADETGQSLLTIVYEDETAFAAFLNDEDARLATAAPELLEVLKIALVEIRATGESEGFFSAMIHKSAKR